MKLPTILEHRRLPSPAVAPQALAWDGKRGVLWMGSRDLRRVYAIDPAEWKVTEDIEAPGIPWAAVSTNGSIRFTIGEGTNDDRYIRSFVPDTGFSDKERIACPEFTGSYLSYDGGNIYLSQWYKHRILKLDTKGNILRVDRCWGGDFRPHICRWDDLRVARDRTERRELDNCTA